MNYSDAFKIAEDIRAQLAEHCEPDRCFIAGSIRRHKLTVGDIEIVALPKTYSESFSLFETDFQDIKMRDKNFIRIIESLGKIQKGKPYDGRMLQIELPYDGLMLDLFMPESKDFFRQFAIRTGSADYSYKTIATAWKRLGWCGTKDGLRLQKESIETERPSASSVWKCTVSNPTLPPIWQSEKEFFEWLKVPYLEPERRF